MPGLGRIAAPDPRDANFPMRALLAASAPTSSTRTYRYWNDNGVWLDQGNAPACVGFGWTHWLEDGPTTQPGTATAADALALYHEAQQLDEFPGDAYEGTSVRGGAKAVQARGRISSYHWATSIDDVVQALLELGPVVVGTNWTRDMFNPDPQGFLQITGPVVGGHCYVLNGVNVHAGFIRAKNSWSRAWGLRGHAFFRVEDFATLLSQDGGEACLAVEVRK